MEILGGLGVLGHIINNSSSNKKECNNSKNNRKNYNKNIYNNDEYKSSMNCIRNKAKKRTKDSKYPNKTGIIPPFYNSNRSFKKKKFDDDNEDSDFSDFSDTSNIYYGKTCDNGTVNLDDSNCFYNKLEDFKNINNCNNNTSTYLTQFDQLQFDNQNNPVSSNTVGDINSYNGDIRKLELERNLALNGGFSNFNPIEDQTYNIVSKNNFVHNNMQPFFNSKDGGFNPYSERKNIENIQRRLETFTGSANNLDYRPKSERKRLFDPVGGLTNIYGTPNMNDIFESRYIPSLEKRNEKPFQDDRVTPGLNLGYNEVGKIGFHDTFRVLPKTVDELRVASKPKKSYCGVVVPGMKGQKGLVPSKTYKRRPLTFWETSHDDNIRGQSYIKAPTVHANVTSDNLASINRGTDITGRLGGPKSFIDSHKPEYLIEKIKVSHKENFSNDIPRNLQKHEANNARGNDNSYNPKETMRTIHNNNDRAGFIGTTQNNKAYVFDNVNNIQDPTMRDIHNKSDRAGFIGTTQNNKSYIYDNINNIQDPTMRDIHDKYDRAGFIGNTQNEKFYVFDKINNTQDPTMRDIHDKYDRVGGVNDHEKQRSRGDANNMRVNTIKEQIALGRKPTDCNYEKGPTFNFTMTNLKVPFNFNREIYPDNQQLTTDRLNFLQRGRNTLPEQSFRFLDYNNENLKNNHLVNNLVHHK